MVVCEKKKISHALDRKFSLNLKKISIDNIIKLFAEQSEMSALPAGWDIHNMHSTPELILSYDFKNIKGYMVYIITQGTIL